MILIDNYDSFTYNVVEYFKELGVNPTVIKNDEMTIDDLKKIDFKSLVISPGPGTPDDSGISMKAIEQFYKTKKILGICLGHQCISQFFGAKIIKDSVPFHGKISKISHTKTSKLFKNIPEYFEVTRYHSLKVDPQSVKKPLLVTACTGDIIMAIEHESLPIYGVQFHPEAILTQFGHEILKNFLDCSRKICDKEHEQIF